MSRRVYAVLLVLACAQAQSDGDCPAGSSEFQLDNFTATFDTYCGYDIPGYDFPSRRPADTFSDCQALCVQMHPLCYAFSYEAAATHSANNCYLKNQAVTSSYIKMQAYHMDSAILDLTTVQTTDDCNSISPRKITERSTYNMFCGSDIVGGDLPPVPALSLSDCLDKCDNNHDCEAVAFEASQHHGLYNCYLKKAGYPDPASQSFAIDAATRVSSAASSTATSATSTSSSSQSSSATSSSTSTSGSSSSSSSSSAAPTTSTNSLTSGAKAGIGVGVAAAVLALAALIWWYVRRRKNSSGQTPSEVTAPEVAEADMYSQNQYKEPTLSARHVRGPRAELESPLPAAVQGDSLPSFTGSSGTRTGS